jgi:putative membrane protein
MEFDGYLWVKGLHVAAAMTFVGGLLAETLFLATLRHGAQAGATPSLLACYRWSRSLTTPAMLLAWGLGVTLAAWAGWFRSGWLMLKLVFVLALSALHGIQSGALRRLAGGAEFRRDFWMPGTIIAVVVSVVCIALLAVTKPF